MTKSELQRAIYRLTFDTDVKWEILKGESVSAMPITKDMCTIHFTNLSEESNAKASVIGG
tara:strand:- start:144 stop:323 length:180 start_codon:yes stop_codon:yes gene_type:complete